MTEAEKKYFVARCNKDLVVREDTLLEIDTDEEEEFLVEVLKKQIPKKPHKYIAFDGIERNGCPHCFEERNANEILYAGQKYCSVCGQKLDWGDE